MCKLPTVVAESFRQEHDMRAYEGAQFTSKRISYAGLLGECLDGYTEWVEPPFPLRPLPKRSALNVMTESVEEAANYLCSTVFVSDRCGFSRSATDCFCCSTLARCAVGRAAIDVQPPRLTC